LSKGTTKLRTLRGHATPQPPRQLLTAPPFRTRIDKLLCRRIALKDWPVGRPSNLSCDSTIYEAIRKQQEDCKTAQAVRSDDWEQSRSAENISAAEAAMRRPSASRLKTPATFASDRRGTRSRSAQPFMPAAGNPWQLTLPTAAASACGRNPHPRPPQRRLRRRPHAACLAVEAMEENEPLDLAGLMCGRPRRLQRRSERDQRTSANIADSGPAATQAAAPQQLQSPPPAQTQAAPPSLSHAAPAAFHSRFSLPARRPARPSSLL
uniref:Uncharacterized protein n=1 Tax=Macrostomum lignano TaxID=282301 RepID=A0A1I8FPN7_9PLAT